MIEAIVALVTVLVIGGAYLAWRHRSERGIESGISSFRRELSALAPRREPRVRRSQEDRTPVEPAPEAGDEPGHGGNDDDVPPAAPDR